MSKYTTIRITDMIESIGENSLKEILSDFSCEYAQNSRNEEIELFLLKNSVDFSKRKVSITYLVMDDKGRIAGYFTLTHKPIVVPAKSLKSQTGIKKMERYAKYDKSLKVYSVSAFLIAQFSKNYNIPSDERISGVELMNNALSIIEDIQKMIGGGVVFLESKEHSKLLDFYSKPPNSFFPFLKRYSDSDKTKYIQLMRFL